MHLEKRQHERREYRVRFRCYMEGGTRYPALSLDLGKGGAFLTSRELPVPGSLIVVEAVDAARRPLPVLLVGRVVRTELGDRVGVGVQWVKAVIRRDPARLAQFLTHFFGLEDLQPPEIPEPEHADPSTKVVYDFRRGTFTIRTQRSGAVLRPDWSLVVEPGPSLPATIDGDPMFQYTSSMSTDLDISFPDEIADAAPPEPPPDLPPGMPSELELSPVPGLPGGEDVED